MKHRPGKARSLPPFPSTTLAPPEIRLANHSVMRSEWRDPDGVRPTAAPRTIIGWLTFDPLRKAMAVAGSSITTEHILAADRLCAAADAVAIGYSGAREPVTIQSLSYGPKTGPGQAALRSARGWPVTDMR